MDSYSELAYYYDLLMDDMDYEGWADYVTEIFERYGAKPKKILDAACGTGNITIPMARKGYGMWGVDLSPEMLAVAKNKSDKQKLNIKFLNQDMSELNINECFDSIICMCDGVNYIIEEKPLTAFFEKAHQKLVEGGIFVFDISSHYKLSTVLGNNSLYQEKDNIDYIWNNNYDEENSLLEMYLAFFIPEKSGLYRKFEEEHVQKAYKEDYLANVLQSQGFKDISVFGEFGFEKPKPECERIFLAARK